MEHPYNMEIGCMDGVARPQWGGTLGAPSRRLSHSFVTAADGPGLFSPSGRIVFTPETLGKRIRSE